MAGTDAPRTPPPAPAPGSQGSGSANGVNAQLRRSETDCYLAGVAGGMAAYFGLPVALIRFGWFLLGIAGGSGLLLYGIAWILIPDKSGSLLDRMFGPTDKAPTPLVIGIGVVAAALLGAISVDGALGLVVPLLLVIGGVALVVREPAQPGPDQAVRPSSMPPPPRPPAYTAPRKPVLPLDPTAPRGPYADAPPTDADPPITTRRKRPRSYVTRLTLVGIVTLFGVLGLADWAGIMGFAPLSATAMALTLVGVGLVVSSRFGRGRGLTFIGLLLTFVLTAGVFVRDLAVAGSEQLLIPRTIAELSESPSMEVGRLEIDLRFLDRAALARLDEPVTMRTSVEIGELVLIVPPDLPIRFTGTVEIGAVTTRVDEPPRPNPEEDPDLLTPPDAMLTGETRAGFDQSLSYRQADPELVILAQVEIGAIRIERRP